MDDKQLGQAVDLASEVRDDLGALIEHYALLPELLRRERDTYRNHEVGANERVADEKSRAADLIEKTVANLKKSLRALATVVGDSVIEDMSLSKSSLLFSRVCSWSEQKGLGGKVLRHLSMEIEQRVEKLLSQSQIVQPKLEVNRFYIDRLSENHRENYAFWQRVLSEFGSTYDNKGGQNKGVHKSALTVKA